MLHLRDVVYAKHDSLVDQIRLVTDYLFIHRQHADCSEDKKLSIVGKYFHLFCDAHDDILRMSGAFEDSNFEEYFETGCLRFAEAFVMASKGDYSNFDIVIDLVYSFRALTKFQFYFNHNEEPLMKYEGEVHYEFNRHWGKVAEEMNHNLAALQTKLGINSSDEKMSCIDQYEEDLLDLCESSEDATISDEDFIDDSSEKEESNNSVPRKRLRRLVD